jgi:two-component system cell cycle response regulator
MVTAADEGYEEKTSVVTSDTLKVKLHEARNAPPALMLLMGPSRQVGKQWPVNKTDLVIGRAVEAHIFVDDRSVSRAHAMVVLQEEKVVCIKDMGSSNGTEVNNDKLEPGKLYPLKNNDQVKTGNVIFKFLESGNLETVVNQATFDKTQLDGLTQIYNKTALTSTGEECVKKAKALDIPLTAVAFDLDNFKMVNDTYGHAAGDYVLRELANVIKTKLIRREDFFARFGGEEFCLIMFGAPLRRGVEVAERIRSTTEKHDFIYEGQKLLITISVGVAALEPEMNDWESLYKKADQASYISKKGGKNRVSTI